MDIMTHIQQIKDTVGELEHRVRAQIDAARDRVDCQRSRAYRTLTELVERVPPTLERVRDLAPKLGPLGPGLEAGVDAGLLWLRRLEDRFPWPSDGDDAASATPPPVPAPAARAPKRAPAPEPVTTSAAAEAPSERAAAASTAAEAPAEPTPKDTKATEPAPEAASTAGAEAATQPELTLETLRGDAAVADNLDEWTKDDLYELAKEADIPGRSGMSKDDLVEALSEWRAAELN